MVIDEKVYGISQVDFVANNSEGEVALSGERDLIAVIVRTMVLLL